MKKNTILLFLFGSLFLSAISGWSQQIHFSDTSNCWATMKSVAPDGTQYNVTMRYHAKDTFYEKNGHQYTIIGCTPEYLPTVMYVREDTAARKTYVIPVNWSFAWQRVTDSSEFLYMDFNMEVGDTLVMPVVLQNSDDSVSVHVVSGIDSQKIGDRWYKRMTMEVLSGMTPSNVPASNFYEITEGIGAYSGPVIEPVSNGNEYGPFRLICFGYQGITPAPFSGECFLPVSITEVDKTRITFKVYPNPSSGRVKISVLKNNANGYLTIMDLTGKSLAVYDIKNMDTELNIGKLKPGLYIFKYTDTNGLVSIQKFIAN